MSGHAHLQSIVLLSSPTAFLIAKSFLFLFTGDEPARSSVYDSMADERPRSYISDQVGFVETPTTRIINIDVSTSKSVVFQKTVAEESCSFATTDSVPSPSHSIMTSKLIPICFFTEPFSSRLTESLASPLFFLVILLGSREIMCSSYTKISFQVRVTVRPYLSLASSEMQRVSTSP